MVREYLGGRITPSDPFTDTLAEKISSWIINKMLTNPLQLAQNQPISSVQIDECRLWAHMHFCSNPHLGVSTAWKEWDETDNVPVFEFGVPESSSPIQNRLHPRQHWNKIRMHFFQFYQEARQRCPGANLHGFGFLGSNQLIPHCCVVHNNREFVFFVRGGIAQQDKGAQE